MGLVINSEVIEETLIQQDAEKMRAEYTKAFKEMEEEAREKQLMEWARDNVIERTLLRQEAIRRDIQVTPQELDEAVKQLKDAYDNPDTLYAEMNCDSEAALITMTALSLKTGKLIEEVRKETPDLSDVQIEQYYQTHAQEFTIPEQIACAHIVKHIQYPTTEGQVMEVMQKAKAELDKGRPFGMVAENYSDCPEQGGSLGAIARGQMVEEFEDIVFHLQPGEISQIFKTRFGYHIATVYDRKPSKIADLKDVRKHIEKILKDQAETDSFYAFLDDLKDKATIQEV